MKKYKFTLILIIGFLSCNTHEKQQDLKNPLVGLWSLHIMEIQDSVTLKWNEWRDGMQGYLLYDNTNNMALHLTTKGYQNTDLIFPNFRDTISLEALKYITNNYNYFGKYTINQAGNVVEHARISHSNPSEWNKIVKRKFTFSGDTLILKPAEKKNARLRLKWVKG